MKKICKWYNNLPNRIKTSVTIALSVVGFIATIMTIAGVSVNGYVQNVWVSLLIIAALIVVIFLISYGIIGAVYENTVSFDIRSMPVEITIGDIFKSDGFKVIGCDTHFDTRVDDTIISKKSLHGQLVLEHGDINEIKAAVDKKAQALGLKANDEDLYDFPLGTVIRYDSKKDNQTYLMLALTEIRKENGQYKAYTSMSKFEETLHRMWEEIDGIYVYNDISLPLLGTGISRFEGGGKNRESLLRCMLCTLNSSGIEFQSKINILIYGNAKDIPLFEFKDMFKSIR